MAGGPVGRGGPAPRLGMYGWFGIKLPLDERMRFIREAGFEATAFWWADADEHQRRVRRALPERIRAAGLHLDNVHFPYRDANALWHHDPDERRAVLDRYIGWVRELGELGVPRAIVHVTQGRQVMPVTEAALDDLARLVEAAEEESVVLAFENTRHPGHIDALLERFDSPAAGLCYDIAHDYLHSRDRFLELVRRWPHRLASVHLSDNDGRLDRHWIPGEGVLDFGPLLDLLDAARFDQVMTIEAVPRRRPADPAEFLDEAQRRVSELLGGDGLEAVSGSA